MTKGYEWPPLGAGDPRASNRVWEPEDPACPVLCRRRRRRRRSPGSLCPTFAGSHVPGALAMPSPTGKATQTSSRRAQVCGGHQGSAATLQPVTQSHRGVALAPEEDAILGGEEGPALWEGVLPGHAAHLPDELPLYWGGAVLSPKTWLPPQMGRLVLSPRNCQGSRPGRILLRICHQPRRGHHPPEKARCHFLRASRGLQASHFKNKYFFY